MYKTWGAMEKLVDQGLARSIGISNFNVQLIMDLLRYARIRPSTLQVEHHPYLTQPDLIKFAQDNGIAVTAYSSFGPLSFIELDFQNAKDTPLLFENETIKTIAQKHGKSPAQVLLRWSTQRGIAVIPKSNNPARLAQNLDVVSFDLSDDELKAISGLNKGLRFNNPVSTFSHFPLRITPLHCKSFLTNRIGRRRSPYFRINECGYAHVPINSVYVIINISYIPQAKPLAL